MSRSSAEEFKEAGNKKFASRDFDGAEQMYSKAIGRFCVFACDPTLELDPDNATYYCNRAAARLALGKPYVS
jgi:hypothetical protein